MLDAEPSTRILWLSRHQPDEAQLGALRGKFGAVVMVVYGESVESAEEVLGLFHYHQCQEMVVVLPVDLLVDLVAALKERQVSVRPIRAVMRRIIMEKGDVASEFSHFERIVDLQMIKEQL